METTFDTLEDMIAYVTSGSRYNSEKKFMLRDRTNREYIDKEAGAAWDKEFYAIPTLYSYRDEGFEPAASYYERQRDELRKTQPKEHQVKYWWLEESGSSSSSWRSKKTISISSELAELLVGIWKTGATYRGSSYTERKGWMTIAGMLKRLGKTDISTQVKKAQQEAEALAAKNRRNYERKEAADYAKKMQELVTKHPEAFDQHIALSITNLIRDIEEKKEF